jgi:hypothetical protein
VCFCCFSSIVVMNVKAGFLVGLFNALCDAYFIEFLQAGSHGGHGSVQSVLDSHTPVYACSITHQANNGSSIWQAQFTRSFWQ